MSHNPLPLKKTYCKLLGRAPLFCQYTEEELTALSRFCRYQRLPGHSQIFQQHQACSAIYYLIGGFVELYSEGPNQQKKTIEFIEGGQTFAEAALFSGQGYPVSAATLLESELISIDSVRFSRFLQKNPQLTWRMLSSLSIRTHRLISQIASLSLFNAEQKVAAYLLEKYDDETPDAPLGGLPYRRQELASRLNLSPETLCRVLQEFKRRGWLLLAEGSQIILLEPTELKQILGRGSRL